MKAFLIILLAAVLWAERAYSLHCHVCNSTTVNTCTNPVNCSTADRYCTTSIRNSSSPDYLLEKGCSPSCPLSTMMKTLVMPQSYLLCCQEDLCNGVGNMRIGYLALAMSIFAGFVVTFVRTGV
ncbi:lymphocyte antigen 6E-like [Chelonia mydas]|uniref:lymphocyte antigen 6E-like n=1 Tax=Chelonia mydas TaxID=8469 RepID=UPI0018A1D706|nr:lymphocyte antigen 6E-like [Chelonia mydas]